MKDNRGLHPHESVGAPRPVPASSRRRILVVEEDRELRLRYAFALSRPGYDVDVAEDGAAGWEALRAKNYHLVITENDLPKLTGVDLVKRLRAARMPVPRVMTAGKLPTDELASNPPLRAAATLAMPFPVESLLAAVRKILSTPDDPRPK